MNEFEQGIKMTAEPKKIEEIYYQALERKSQEERTAFLDEACAGDADLRGNVEALLRSNDKAGNFLEAPPVDCEVTLDAGPIFEGPGTVIGPYKLLEKIGEGGMAVVYMAEQDRPLRRRVALKIIKLGMDTKQVIARFDAERQVLALMDHPNIAKVFHAGATDTGRPYFAMELVRGMPITEYCDQKNLSTAERLELFVPVCQAVYHAHQKGIIHRDLKPTNIMVTLHDSKPVPMVIDFGIAKATNRRMTEQTLFTRYAEMIGTPEYMSPEQAETSGLDIDTRTDIYSLGIVLYELLTGVLPFDSEILRKAAIGEIQRIIRDEEPPRPSTRLSGLGRAAEEIAACRQTDVVGLTRRLHRELEWIPMKAMRKDRNRRYRSILEFTDDIHNYLTGTPLIAGPESALYRMQKFVHRHRLSLVTATSIAAILILGFFVSLSFYFQEKRTETQNIHLTVQHRFAEGRYQEALEKANVYLQADGSDSNMQLLKAQLLFSMGDTETARPLLEVLTDSEPETAGAAHYLLSRIYLESNPDKAKKHQVHAKSLLPQSVDVYVFQAMTAATPDAMIDSLSTALEMEPNHRTARLCRAFAYYHACRYDEMLTDAVALVATSPKDAFGYAARALAQRELGNLEKALKDHDQAISLCQRDSDLFRYLSQRGETLWHMKDYPGAIGDAEKCLDLKPQNIAPRIALARALFFSGQYEAAAREFAHINRNPMYPYRFSVLNLMVRHTLELAREGKFHDIPGHLSGQWPFPDIMRSTATYRQIASKARWLSRAQTCALSPDGKQLVYTNPGDWHGIDTLPPSQTGSVGTGYRGRLEILNIETGKRRVLVRSGEDPVWSPDGQYIAFGRHPRRGSWEIWLISAEGDEERCITAGYYPSWGKDSRRLYFRANSITKAELYSIDIDDPLAKPRYVMGCPGYFPQVSPDGRYLAYAKDAVLTIRELGTGREVAKWVVPGAGDPGFYSSVQWSPDATEISLGVVGRHDLLDSGLWIYSLEQKRGWHVLDSTGYRCFWSNDRRRIAIHLLHPASEVWLVETDPNLSTREALGLHQNRADYLRENWKGIVQSTHGAWSTLQNQIVSNLTALATNQYDYTQFGEARWLLERLDELQKDLQGTPHPHILVLSAKTLHRLGDQANVEVALNRLRRIFTSDCRHDEGILFDAEQTLTTNDTLRATWNQMAVGELKKASDTLMEIKKSVVTGARNENTESIQSLKKALARAFWRQSKDTRHQGGPVDGTIESLKRALQNDPNCIAALKDLAWIQAVCPDATVRSSVEARANAQRANELTKWKDSDCLTALAAACGEAGDFELAAKWQQQALGLASSDGCAGMRREMQLRLENYEKGKHLPVNRLESLVAHWDFDHTQGEILTDVSGNGHGGRLRQAAKLATYRDGTALMLRWKVGYVECPNESAFDFADQMTLSCWIRVNRFFSPCEALVSKGYSAWQLIRDKKTEHLAFHCAGLESRQERGVVGQTDIVDDQWHHIAASFDGQRLYLYVDGILDASEPVSGRIARNNKPVWIGAVPGGPNLRSMSGNVDDVRVYSRSLTLDEIRSLYEQEGVSHTTKEVERSESAKVGK